jgi:hypothetical protein
MKWICFFAMLIGVTVTASPTAFQSADRQTALLELYTSEGCSSCPPAETWLSRLKAAPGLWHEFVPVAFHVDYWDNLGWHDKLSSARFSDRQRSYARVWSAENIYTPEFVLNGREWGNWLGFRGAPSMSANKVGVLRVNSNDNRRWRVDFAPTEKGTRDYEVTAALLVGGLDSQITGGENSGRHLNHDFAALSLVTCPLASQTNGFRGSFVIEAKPKSIIGRLALAVWVTHGGEIKPLQATGGWLPQPEKITSSTNQSTQQP